MNNPVNKQGTLKNSNKQANFTNNDKRVGKRTDEAWADEKVGFYFTVVDALLKTGFNEDEIGKIGGGSYCPIFNKAH